MIKVFTWTTISNGVQERRTFFFNKEDGWYYVDKHDGGPLQRHYKASRMANQKNWQLSTDSHPIVTALVNYARQNYTGV